MSGPGSRRDHDRFCQVEGWTVARDARGRKVRHHVTYELELPDGRVLRTRISRPPNNETYGPSLWSHILETQLEVTEAEFWTCVNQSEPPNRGQTADEAPTNALPASLVYQLIHVAFLSEAEVATMTLDRALAVMREIWSRP